MEPTEKDFENTAIATCEKKGWPMPNGLMLAEGSLVLACVKAGYALAAAPASVTTPNVWVLQDTGNNMVVGIYGTEAAARQAIEPDRAMKVHPTHPDYYSVEEMAIESPASPAASAKPSPLSK